MGVESTPLAFVLTGGQAGDAPVFGLLVDQIVDECPVDFIATDKAYDSDAIRELLVDLDICPVIPSTANRIEPIPHDEERYKVERFFGKLKRFRRIGIRYDKLAITFMAFVHLTSSLIMIR